MYEAECPNCGHKIILPKSCIIYVCICGKEYRVIIKNDENGKSKTTKETNRETGT